MMDSFSDVKIISGQKGLNNIVKWTHIIESERFISSLNGGELILTTGIGLASHPYAKVSFIEQLIIKKVAAICIELGNKFRSISPEIIKLSNETNTPIIIFPGIVKFVDITHEVHRFMVNSHFQILNRLYILSKKFNALSLLPNGILKILQELHTNIKTPVFYIQRESKHFYYPPEARDMEKEIRHILREKNIVNNNVLINDKTFILNEVKNSNQISGYLCLQIKEKQNGDFLHTVLDHASLAISQIILRNEIVEERKQFNEDEMVQNFLQGSYNDIKKLDTLLPFSYKNASFRVVVILFNNKDSDPWHDWSESKLRMTFLIRNIFKRNNLFPIISIRENEINIICFTTLNINDVENNRNLYGKLSNSLVKDMDLQELLGTDYKIGIGKCYNNINMIQHSYNEAKRVIELQFNNIINVLFYENVGIYDVLFQLNSREQTEPFIRTHLGSILDLEPKTREELLDTLETFLDFNGSFKKASEKLYVVRQTLYHRVNKLYEILGKDFMKPPNRLALEFAIKAYRYFETVKKIVSN